MLDPANCARFHALLAKYTRSYRAGSHIKDEAGQSHSTYVTLDGWAALTKSLPEGQTQVIDFRLPGDISNLVSADGETVMIGFEAITDLTVAVVPVKDWKALEAEIPQLASIRDQSAAAVRSRIVERMLRLGRGNGEQRLAYAFLELAVRCGAVHDDRIGCFSIPLTQQRLGDFMGLTAIPVCRTLRRMKSRGLIATSDHLDVFILDIEALEDLAGIRIATLARAIQPCPPAHPSDRTQANDCNYVRKSPRSGCPVNIG
jgi:CRP-like cAMP-binding protein